MSTLLRSKMGELATFILASILAVILTLVFLVGSSAQDNIRVETRKLKKLELAVGKSIILKSSKQIDTVNVAAPGIAAVEVFHPDEVYISGKAQGITSITLWQKGKVTAIYDLEVVYDISRLKRKLNEILPGEKDLRVFASGDSITLSGRISSASNLSQAMALAEAYAPKGNVRNLVEVSGIHQVMLEVRVAEMKKSLMKRLGVNFTYNRGDEFAGNSIGNLAQLVSPEDATLMSGPIGLLISPAVNAFFRVNQGDSSWTGLIDALKMDGLLKVLAEPTLIALSGQTAHFLAGGEYPVPVPQGLGTVGIEYKEYGVGLSFTPTVLSKNKISIKVSPEVSELDFSTALRVGGFTIPGLTTRRAATVVELADGQSFAIAGLLSETARDTFEKYPKLGEIPVLGRLFQSREFQREESELVIIVTPRLVKPLDLKAQTLPTDYYVEPDDADFYLWGLMEGKKKGKSSAVQGELDGDFGHALPVTD
jgi:pilus assembly protein CpaC